MKWDITFCLACAHGFYPFALPWLSCNAIVALYGKQSISWLHCITLATHTTVSWKFWNISFCRLSVIDTHLLWGTECAMNWETIWNSPCPKSARFRSEYCVRTTSWRCATKIGQTLGFPVNGYFEDVIYALTVVVVPCVLAQLFLWPHNS